MMITVSSVAFVGRRGKLFPDLPSDLTGSSLTPREHFLEKIGNVFANFFWKCFWKCLWHCDDYQVCHSANTAIASTAINSHASCKGSSKKRFYLVQLAQMWVGGVGWIQTFINQCFCVILTPHLQKIHSKNHISWPKSLFFRGWVHKFGSIDPNKTVFLELP